MGEFDFARDGEGKGLVAGELPRLLFKYAAAPQPVILRLAHLSVGLLGDSFPELTGATVRYVGLFDGLAGIVLEELCVLDSALGSNGPGVSESMRFMILGALVVGLAGA